MADASLAGRGTTTTLPTDCVRLKQIKSRIVKSQKPFWLKALGDSTAAGKSNYGTDLPGTAIQRLKAGFFSGLGAKFRAEKSNCENAAGRATTEFLASVSLRKVELSSHPTACGGSLDRRGRERPSITPGLGDQNTLPIC